MAQWNVSADIVAGVGGALVPWVTYQIVPYGAGTTKVYRWSDVPVALRDGYVAPGLVSWTRVVRALSDDYGGFENQSFGWVLADVDRTLLDLTHDATFKYWSNQYCTIQLCNVAGLRGGDTPMVVARGMVQDVKIGAERQLTFTAADYLTTQYSVTYLDEKLPRRRIVKTIFTDCYDGAINADGSQQPTITGLPEPVIYGTVSDSDLVASSRKGAVPGLPVGTESISGNPSWVRVLIAGHACKEVENLYLGGVLVDAGRYGVDVHCPGKTGWSTYFAAPYRDIGGRRYTIVYLIGPAATGVVDGSAPLTADVKGIESVGDGSGTLLTSVYDQYQHWLVNFAMGDYQTGGWGTAPLFEDGATSYVDAASFAKAKTDRPSYDGGGVIGANGDIRAKREWLKAWNTSGDLRCGFSRLGQFYVTTGEATALRAAFYERYDVIAGSLQIEPRLDAMRNIMPYSFRRDWSRNAWTTDQRRIYSSASIDAYGIESEDALRELWFVRSGTVADDLMRHFLHRKMHPPRRYAFETGLHGLLADLGGLITLNHTDGSALSASEDNPIMVERVETDVAAGVVRLSGWDYSTMDTYPMPADYLSGSGAPISGGYSYGTGVSSGGGGGTVVVNVTAQAAPAWFGGGEDLRTKVPTAGAWVRGFNGGEVILNTAKMPAQVDLSILMLADALTGGNAQVQVVSGSGDWSNRDVRPMSPACVPVTDGANWVWHGYSIELRPGIYAYRVEVTSSVSGSDIGFRAYLQW